MVEVSSSFCRGLSMGNLAQIDPCYSALDQIFLRLLTFAFASGLFTSILILSSLT